MSVSDKLNVWFDQFIKIDDNADKKGEEQWALQSLTSMTKLFDAVYGEIPNKPATSKIHTFLTIMVNTINQAHEYRRTTILTKFYQLKTCYSSILSKSKPGELYMNYLPHNLKVFYIDIITILMKFPGFKPALSKAPETVDQEEVVGMNSEPFMEDIVNYPINEQIEKLLSIIPLNTDLDKKLVMTKNVIITFIKQKIHTIELLTAVLDELLTEKYEYLRRDKNLLRTLTGTFARNQTWLGILNEIKQKALDMVKLQVTNHETISDEVWLLTESIINERAMAAALFRDHYSDELEAIHRKYIMRSKAEQVI